jgi:hypothetical protein
VPRETVTTRRTEEADERDPDARRPLTDAMTWGETQRMWARVYKKERDRFEAERDTFARALRLAVASPELREAYVTQAKDALARERGR